jgi:hypothetical protein
MRMTRKSISMDYTEQETTARAEAALKRMLATPPKPHSEMKIGKRKTKASAEASPKKRDWPKKASPT